MTVAVELGHGEGAEGDPGPSVYSFSPGDAFTDRHQAIVVHVRRNAFPFALFASFANQAEEIVWRGGFVAPYARKSTAVGDVFTIRRSAGWPPGSAPAIRIEATGEGQSVCLGGA